MPAAAKAFRVVLVSAFALLPMATHGEGIDTEHIFGFMIGSDVGNAGEREFQSQITGRFAKTGGVYRAGDQEFELEFVPFRDFRIEIGTAFAGYDIRGVSGIDDRRQLAWQGGSLDLRYRLLDRATAPFGMTFALQNEVGRFDDVSGAPARQYGAALTLAVDREIVPDLAVAALNLSYQPEWTRVIRTDDLEREVTLGIDVAVMAQLRPEILLGGEARYMRRYDGLGLDALSGQALFVGPTVYIKLSERARLTAAWSMQAWGRSADRSAALDLVNFERYQARMVFGVNF